MAKRSEGRVMVAEQLLEVRYSPSGSFLDVRGFVADFLREKTPLKHWKIDANVVNFRDAPFADSSKEAHKDGAFAGYRSAGYIVFDPETRNYFVDRSSNFWKILQKNGHYDLPSLERFGARTKIFIPSDKSFEDINSNVFDTLYSKVAKEVVGGTELDVMFVIDIKEQEFNVRVSGGPIHKNEAGKYFGFESTHFQSAGFFLDLDYSRGDSLKHDDVPRMVRSAVALAWEKAERIAGVVGV